MQGTKLPLGPLQESSDCRTRVRQTGTELGEIRLAEVKRAGGNVRLNPTFPPEASTDGVSRVVGAGNTPCRTLSRRCLKWVAEQELAGEAPRTGGLDGNRRILVVLMPTKRSHGAALA